MQMLLIFNFVNGTWRLTDLWKGNKRHIDTLWSNSRFQHPRWFNESQCQQRNECNWLWMSLPSGERFQLGETDRNPSRQCLAKDQLLCCFRCWLFGFVPLLCFTNHPPSKRTANNTLSSLLSVGEGGRGWTRRRRRRVCFEGEMDGKTEGAPVLGWNIVHLGVILWAIRCLRTNNIIRHKATGEKKTISQTMRLSWTSSRRRISHGAVAVHKWV